MSWSLVRLGDICNFVRGPFGGALKKESFVEDGFAVYEQQHAIYNQFSDIRYYIDSDKFEDLKRFELHAGDIIMSCSGTMGKVAVVPDGIKQGIINQALLKLTPNCNLDIAYFMHWLKSESFQFQLGLSSHGAAIKNVASVKVLKELEIPLPPLEEQKRIAAILDKAGAIRQKRKQAIDLADEFLRSVFLDMFGDPVTNPKGWEVEKFADVGSLDRGKSKHRPRNDPKLLGGLHPLVQTGDVANSKGYLRSYTSTYSDFGLAQSKKWPAGTLCITIAANIAKTGILTFDACFPDSVVGFTPNSKTTTEYVQAWISFLQKILEANAPESAQKNINLAILRDLDIPVPPISEQKKFTMIVEKVNSVLNRARASNESKEQLFNSLSQKAFSGQL
ncbi:restriction endonuclease subunit S [Vibrio cholerae]|uniref:restriction endonuclease subunit S n=1 Tax=Vibrio TaxID=662 RepID=UPI00084B4608|nr:restriction endonuclease subunit S [Vibrio cholerae]EJL6415316.1 restriction endonuclease subunit S [Vibrio cholerae]EJL6452467.1 restriction endonuclease subunit S [Vibrio cholerae]NOF77045.1 restriction endonuclease subunit S [Vibrio cholerae]NOF79732.1 restriction endonuclease subunit S [Vibrio cholerae]OEC32292.1 hypothetical protein BFX13_14230 [Vibrio cholerae]